LQRGATTLVEIHRYIIFAIRVSLI
jgi:hypothetical protein